MGIEMRFFSVRIGRVIFHLRGPMEKGSAFVWSFVVSEKGTRTVEGNGGN